MAARARRRQVTASRSGRSCIAITLASLDDYRDLDVLIFAVSHQEYIDQRAELLSRIKPGGVVVDVKSALDPKAIPAGLRYWSL